MSDPNIEQEILRAGKHLASHGVKIELDTDTRGIPRVIATVNMGVGSTVIVHASKIRSVIREAVEDAYEDAASKCKNALDDMHDRVPLNRGRTAYQGPLDEDFY